MKLALKVTGIVLALTMTFGTTAFAVSSESNTKNVPTAKTNVTTKALGNFTDSNNDGVCDNKDTSKSNCTGFTDNDNNGVCDNKKSNKSNCAGFTDNDNDSVCDNKSAKTKAQNKNNQNCLTKTNEKNCNNSDKKNSNSENKGNNGVCNREKAQCNNDCSNKLSDRCDNNN